jgi:hypothetical protein
MHDKDFGIKIEVFYKDQHIEFFKDKAYMLVNDYKVPIENAFVIRLYITFVPINVIKKAFDAEIQSSSNFRIATIIY